MSGPRELSLIVSEFSERLGGIVRGAPPLNSDYYDIFTLFPGAVLILLPLFCNLLLVFFDNRRPWQFFNLVAWVCS